MGDGNLDYAERLRIELMGATHRIWHRSFGQDRGEVALTAVGVDPAGSRSRILTYVLPSVTTLGHLSRFLGSGQLRGLRVLEEAGG